MKSSLVRLGCIAVLAGAVALSADVTIQYTGLSDVVVKNISIVGGAGDLGGSSYNGGVYTGLYNAKVVQTGQVWQTFCIDPIGEISPNVPWNATLLTTADLNSGKGVLYTDAYGTNDSWAKDKYGMIAYLANTYYYNTNPAVDNAAERADLSLAFWEIARDYTGSYESMDLSSGNFKSTSGNTSDDYTLVSNLIKEAFDNFDNKDAPYQMSVYSPTERPSQEFLAFRVPEPAMFGMLLTGLCALGGLGIVRRRKTI
jgi:hypothetical protein